MFSRYYPLVVAPFHFWGFIGDHEIGVCDLYYTALYACMVPTVRSLAPASGRLFPHTLIIGAVFTM